MSRFGHWLNRGAHLGIVGVLLLSTASMARASANNSYPWLEGYDEPVFDTLDERFETPAGFQRVELEANSYEAWLRALPLLERLEVRSHAGTAIRAPAAAVLALDVGKRDLQQCADSIIRLRAEFLWSRGRFDDIAFHFTSGDRSAWSDWSKGERFKIGKGRVERTRSGAKSSSYESFGKYLTHLFIYAGTRSLSKDAEAVPESEALRAGDFFVQGGSPGHAVLILDVAEHSDGRQVALLGQGFMPAQEFHVLQSSKAIDGVWFLLPAAGQSVETPSWQAFERSNALRFR